MNISKTPLNISTMQPCHQRVALRQLKKDHQPKKMKPNTVKAANTTIKEDTHDDTRAEGNGTAIDSLVDRTETATTATAATTATVTLLQR